MGGPVGQPAPRLGVGEAQPPATQPPAVLQARVGHRQARPHAHEAGRGLGSRPGLRASAPRSRDGRWAGAGMGDGEEEGWMVAQRPAGGDGDEDEDGPWCAGWAGRGGQGGGGLTEEGEGRGGGRHGRGGTDEGADEGAGLGLVKNRKIGKSPRRPRSAPPPPSLGPHLPLSSWGPSGKARRTTNTASATARRNSRGAGREGSWREGGLVEVGMSQQPPHVPAPYRPKCEHLHSLLLAWNLVRLNNPPTLLGRSGGGAVDSSPPVPVYTGRLWCLWFYGF